MPAFFWGGHSHLCMAMETGVYEKHSPARGVIRAREPGLIPGPQHDHEVSRALSSHADRIHDQHRDDIEPTPLRGEYISGAPASR